VEQGFKLVASFPRFRHLPVILSEADPEGCAACSSRMNPANGYRNGTLYPAYTATAFKALLDLRDRYGVDLISMLSWSFEFEDTQYFEGFRSLATNGIDKPILNLFRMLGLMGGDRVRVTSRGASPLDTVVQTGVRETPDVDGLATREGKSASVLVWNYHDVNEAAAPAAVQVSVRGIPDGVHRVLVEQFRIDAQHSDAYTAWQAMGSPQPPDADQIAKLQRAGQLQLLTSPEWVGVQGGAVVMPTSLPRESVELVRLQWE
jgi:xylan 1,4-beta-xylosidase